MLTFVFTFLSEHLARLWDSRVIYFLIPVKIMPASAKPVALIKYRPMVRQSCCMLCNLHKIEILKSEYYTYFSNHSNFNNSKKIVKTY
jgi:hypothetical protein